MEKTWLKPLPKLHSRHCAAFIGPVSIVPSCLQVGSKLPLRQQQLMQLSLVEWFLPRGNDMFFGGKNWGTLVHATAPHDLHKEVHCATPVEKELR